MIRKSFEVKSAEQKGNQLIVSGIANFAAVDRVGDLIDPKAWRLENYKKNPIILFNHNENAIIGKALRVEATENGLEIEAEIGNAELAELTEKQREVRSLIAQGILRAFSVGFMPLSSEKVGDVNKITEAELFEISLVSIPCNADSIVTEIKVKQLVEAKEKQMEEQLQKISEVLALLLEKVSYIYDKLQSQEQQQQEPQPAENEETKKLRERIVELEKVLAKFIGE